MNSSLKFLNKRLFALGLCLLMMFSVIRAPQALAGTGDGSGSGGGQQKPLEMVDSVPAHGQQDVALTTEVKLMFNKNVVHMTVCDDNKQCFSLYAGDTQVPIEVIMADDQIEPEKRREVLVKPLQDLIPGVSYTVRVAPQMQSKSGVALGTEETMTFTTVGAAPAAAAPATPAGDTLSSDKGGDTPVSSEPEKQGDTVEQPSAEPETQEKESPAAGEAEAAPSADTDDDNRSIAAKLTGNSTTIPLVLVLLALGWLGYRSYKKYRAQ